MLFLQDNLLASTQFFHFPSFFSKYFCLRNMANYIISSISFQHSTICCNGMNLEEGSFCFNIKQDSTLIPHADSVIIHFTS